MAQELSASKVTKCAIRIFRSEEWDKYKLTNPDPKSREYNCAQYRNVSEAKWKTLSGKQKESYRVKAREKLANQTPRSTPNKNVGINHPDFQPYVLINYERDLPVQERKDYFVTNNWNESIPKAALIRQRIKDHDATKTYDRTRPIWTNFKDLFGNEHDGGILDYIGYLEKMHDDHPLGKWTFESVNWHDVVGGGLICNSYRTEDHVNKSFFTNDAHVKGPTNSHYEDKVAKNLVKAHMATCGNHKTKELDWSLTFNTNNSVPLHKNLNVALRNFENQGEEFARRYGGIIVITANQIPEQNVTWLKAKDCQDVPLPSTVDKIFIYRDREGLHIKAWRLLHDVTKGAAKTTGTQFARSEDGVPRMAVYANPFKLLEQAGLSLQWDRNVFKTVNKFLNPNCVDNPAYLLLDKHYTDLLSLHDEPTPTQTSPPLIDPIILNQPSSSSVSTPVPQKDEGTFATPAKRKEVGGTPQEPKRSRQVKQVDLKKDDLTEYDD